MHYRNAIARVRAVARFMSVLSCGVVLGAVPAFAGKASFGIPTLSLEATGGAVAELAFRLHPDISSTASFTIILPVDYEPDTRLRVDVSMYAASGTPCDAVIVPAALSRVRNGETFFNNSDGFKVRGGEPLTSFTDNFRIVKKTFLVDPSATFPGQRRGDLLTLLINRASSDAEDTCPVVFVHAVNAIYRTR